MSNKPRQKLIRDPIVWSLRSTKEKLKNADWKKKKIDKIWSIWI